MQVPMQDGMAEATRLTRAGRLAEATALIQRILAGSPATDVSTAASSHDGAPIDAAFRVVDADPPSLEPSEDGGARDHKTEGVSATARPPSASSIFSPNPAQVPGDISSASRPIRPVRPGLGASPIQPGGQFLDKAYTNTAGTRAYKLYIPGGYTGKAAPLVVMLHGCSQTPVDFADGTRMNVFAEGQTFLVAYPAQGSSANSSKCWNWFEETNQRRAVGEPSLIAGITQQIMREYSIDARRVYIAGLSSGGAMAVTMAVTYPDLYAAVGVHSGLAYGAAHDLPSAFTAMMQGTQSELRPLTKIIPLIAFHGDRDMTVAPVNLDLLLDQWLQAASVRQGNARRSARDAKVERGLVASGYAYTRSIYHDGSGQASVEKWLVHQEGHAWSGGSPSGSFTDPRGPDASAEMARFFSEHPRDR